LRPPDCRVSNVSHYTRVWSYKFRDSRFKSGIVSNQAAGAREVF
jgi:hypothetical protein